MPIRSTPVGVPAYNTRLLGNLSVPDHPTAVAVIAYTNTNARGTAPEQLLGVALREHQLAILQLDLLTSDEVTFHSIGRRSHHDVGVLAKRLVAAMEWVSAQAQFGGLPRAFIGAGMGTAATLTAAAERPDMTHAIVSIDGWTDRAMNTLEHVRAPTLLIAGRKNSDIVMMNESAFQRLQSLKRLELIDDVANVLTNSGALDMATRLTAIWFQRFLRHDVPEPQ
jgi:hypothetical protein